ncbi:phosphoribosylanthranilate isomerase [Tangfeifania diversioriginum]|uniref:N-(5'-phosphoribosyl)anthranilate isomerase n=1 Tax=Tangfeifania diversioriginum TaxID=1168035 RepID=A0A1M6JH51_9BACT|nr:phosphoribosylanthranilate isomerase [Tangfeifania diversioriginum]SHJ46000.1 phosphoribosylanthranilate isomerase [Tangfeifania diversioriginum]
MKFNQNREEVEKLPVDFLGFIFYPKSKRFVGENTEPGLFNSAKTKVAVFVDENAFEILGLTKNLGFEFVQLHGKENPKTCLLLKDQGLKVIKAFNLSEKFQFEKLREYETTVDYFLFDTKTELPGGSGKKFNWEILEKYQGTVPFFLSGGIGPEDAEAIKKLQHPRLFGIDLNSGFEDEPGVKNVGKLKEFITRITM